MKFTEKDSKSNRAYHLLQLNIADIVYFLIDASRRLTINSLEIIINFNQSVVIDGSQAVVTFSNEYEKITRLRLAKNQYILIYHECKS